MQKKNLKIQSNFQENNNLNYDLNLKITLTNPKLTNETKNKSLIRGTQFTIISKIKKQ